MVKSTARDCHLLKRKGGKETTIIIHSDLIGEYGTKIIQNGDDMKHSF